MTDENFLSRWSRRKTASKAASEAGPARPTADAVPAQAGTEFQDAAPSLAAPSTPDPVPAESKPLPPVESLTFESDFAPFMQPGVEPGLRRTALKTLLYDPRFNVMDGLDVYIDDYSKPDPLPEGWLEKMTQVKHLGHYIAPAEAVEPVPGEAAEDDGKAIAEQPVDAAAAIEPPDTSSPQISPPQVGKAPPGREGDPDVLV